MKYTDYSKGIPQLFLGEIDTFEPNNIRINYEVKVGGETVQEGVGQLLGMSIDDVDVEESGLANNVKLAGKGERAGMYLTNTVFTPEIAGLGPKAGK